MDFVKTINWSFVGVIIIYKWAIKCEKFIIYTVGENNSLHTTDVEAWKYSDRTGLETLVVYTTNDEH